MTWKELLEKNRVAREPAIAQEIADLRALAARAFADATIEGPLSDDGRFERAYDAARALATVVVRGSGYRVRGSGGNHYVTFLALEAAAPRFQSYAAYFNLCREKRNQLAYIAPGRVSRTEVEELVRELPKFRRAVEEWLGHGNL